MNVRPTSPSPPPSRGVLEIAWSYPIPGGARGLALAREKGWLLAWDEKHWLYLLNRVRAVQAQKQIPGGVSAACSADDGSAYAAAGPRGDVCWLAPDLMPRWERTLHCQVVALALDSFGQYLAASDVRGNLHLFDRRGRTLCQVESPRPFHYLSFVPAAPNLLGVADYGLVACFDVAGQWVWRDGLVAHVGALGVTGAGERIALACFSEGLQCYDLSGKKLDRIALSGPVRLASLSYEGHRILASILNKQVHLFDADARERGTLQLDKAVVAIALSALADAAYLALADGPILGLNVTA